MLTATAGCETNCQASSGADQCHNYGFTAELHTTFVYRDTSDGFFFSSADDLWVCEDCPPSSQGYLSQPEDRGADLTQLGLARMPVTFDAKEAAAQ